MVTLVVDDETAIIEVLDEAWDKFAGGKVGAYLDERDADFEQFVIDRLQDLGANGVVWYTSSPNCHFVVNFNGRFYDVDYVTYDIREIDKEEAIERASWGLTSKEEAYQYLGIEPMVAKFEVFETDDEEGTGQATNVTKVLNLTYVGPDADEVYGAVLNKIYYYFYGLYDIVDSSNEEEESVFVDMPCISVHAEVKSIEHSDDLSNKVSRDKFIAEAERWLQKIKERVANRAVAPSP